MSGTKDTYESEKNRARMSHIEYAPVDSAFAKVVNWSDIHSRIRVIMLPQHQSLPLKESICLNV